MADISFKLLIKISLLFCLTFCMACDSDSETPQEEIPIETELQWQLSAIIENGEKLATPGNCMSAYLIFEEGDKFDGRVGVNQLKGTFKAYPSSGKVSMEYSLTQVASLEPNVMEFEKMYMKFFDKITSYTYTKSDNNLKLYYGDNSYLEYQSKEVEKIREQPANAIKTNLNWKLVKFEETGGEITIPKELIEAAKAYVIQFKDDGSFDGYTSANEIKGSYTSNMATGKIELKLEQQTQVADILYGDFEKIYLDNLFKRVYSYSQSDDGLYLYFNKNSYLKYQAK